LSEKDGRFVSVSGLYTVVPTKVSMDTFWIGWFGVLPEYRRSGVGHQVITMLMKKAKALGGKKLMLYTESKDARKFYDAVGFTFVSTVGQYLKKNKDATIHDFESPKHFIYSIDL
jgi:ribosomal protein S18 acetylase RimI-like enzyme